MLRKKEKEKIGLRTRRNMLLELNSCSRSGVLVGLDCMFCVLVVWMHSSMIGDSPIL